MTSNCEPPPAEGALEAPAGSWSRPARASPSEIFVITNNPPEGEQSQQQGCTWREGFPRQGPEQCSVQGGREDMPRAHLLGQRPPQPPQPAGPCTFPRMGRGDRQFPQPWPAPSRSPINTQALHSPLGLSLFFRGWRQGRSGPTSQTPAPRTGSACI